MVSPTLAGEKRTNRQLETADADGTVLSRLLTYMDLQENDNKLAIEKKVTTKGIEAKSAKRLIKRGTWGENNLCAAEMVHMLPAAETHPQNSPKGTEEKSMATLPVQEIVQPDVKEQEEQAQQTPEQPMAETNPAQVRAVAGGT